MPRRYHNHSYLKLLLDFSLTKVLDKHAVGKSRGRETKVCVLDQLMHLWLLSVSVCLFLFSNYHIN